MAPKAKAGGKRRRRPKTPAGEGQGPRRRCIRPPLSLQQLGWIVGRPSSPPSMTFSSKALWQNKCEICGSHVDPMWSSLRVPGISKVDLPIMFIYLPPILLVHLPPSSKYGAFHRWGYLKLAGWLLSWIRKFIIISDVIGHPQWWKPTINDGSPLSFSGSHGIPPSRHWRRSTKEWGVYGEYSGMKYNSPKKSWTTKSGLLVEYTYIYTYSGI